MFRLWGKLYKNNRILKDTVICNDESALSTDKKVDHALYEICMQFDLQKPLWLKDNHKDFKQFRRTSFRKDHFIEQIDFDYLEIEIIEADK
ncbi:MAG: hypothetical protein CVU84_16730 [Firmicutes bacterium HGW-Firmicutes-1]|jgi:hypothetical protein|nr:MAG: hypothetical protein CVU84_16730 [Firmicutes bacterium HGW-Firmicutes-1]